MTCDVCHDDQFPDELVGKNLVCIICYPLMPEYVREWLRVNDDVPADKLKCPMCGDYFASIDHLAPYHWETCWCAKCQMHPLQPLTCRLCGGTGEWMPGMKECPDCKTPAPRSNDKLRDAAT